MIFKICKFKKTYPFNCFMGYKKSKQNHWDGESFTVCIGINVLQDLPKLVVIKDYESAFDAV